MPDFDYRVPVPEGVKKTMNEIGRIVGRQLPDGWGFALLVFTYGDAGTMAWISNAQRADMLKAMSEFIQKQGS